jgi:lysophospholipase L1-like esterase
VKESAKNLTALALGLVLALVVSEVGLRTYQALVRGIPFFSLLPGYHPSARFPLSPFLVFGPRVNEQLEDKQHPETSYFNHQGFRTRDTLGPKPAGQYRIIALGGSTTVDRSNEEGIHWPLVVEQRLHAAGRTDVRVYNAAMSAYSSAHSLVRLEFDILPYQPDLILVMDNINDLSVNYYAWHAGVPVDPNYQVKYGRRESTGVITGDDIVLWRVGHSVWVRVRDLMRRPPAPPATDYAIDRGRAFFTRNLRNIVALARANGVAVMLVTTPMCDDPAVYEQTRRDGGEPTLYPPFERFRADFESYNEAVREVGAELRVPVLDARRAVPGDRAYFLDVVHHTSAGVRAVGEAVAAQLLPLLAPAPSRRDHH